MTFPSEQNHCQKSVIVLLMQTPCQGGHRGVRTQSYGGTGPCWPPLEPPLPGATVINYDAQGKTPTRRYQMVQKALKLHVRLWGALERTTKSSLWLSQSSPLTDIRGRRRRNKSAETFENHRLLNDFRLIVIDTRPLISLWLRKSRYIY